MGVDHETLDQNLLTLERPGGIGDPRFMERVARQVYYEEVKLVILDPLYAFHGGEAEMSNLFAQGQLLSEFTHQILEAGASLLLVHHTKKTESGPPDLRSLAGAAGGEWPDSWVLTWHLSDPKPRDGEYHLAVEVASRQGIADYFELRWYDGNHPRWEFTRADETIRHRRGERKVTDDSLSGRVLTLCETPQTKRMLEQAVEGVGDKRVRAAVDELAERGELMPVRWHHTDAGGRSRVDDAWLRQELAPANGEVWEEGS